MKSAYTLLKWSSRTDPTLMSFIIWKLAVAKQREVLASKFSSSSCRNVNKGLCFNHRRPRCDVGSEAAAAAVAVNERHRTKMPVKRSLFLYEYN